MARSGDSFDAKALGNFDQIIVGGGSAGCVLASRLSAFERQRVLLIEAGDDFVPGVEPELIRDPASRALFSPGLFWPGLLGTGASLVTGQSGRPLPMIQARVMGGGSSINGMHAQRGEASDYDEWSQMGVVGWSWEEVLPFFKKLETDLDFRGPMHGSDGPVIIKRHGPESWSEVSLSLGRMLGRRGCPRLVDLNGESGPGFGPVPLNATDRRMSAAVAYLTPSVRARPNLSILSNTPVKRILFDGVRATGVELEGPTSRFVYGANVIISSGAIHSPHLLLRSGIGPADQLAECGVRVVADRVGVGKNLQNHPMISVSLFLARAARSRKLAAAPCLLAARLSSGVLDCPASDLILNLWERVPSARKRDPLARQFADLMLLLNKGFSKGTVALKPGDPFGSPEIETNILQDPRDRQRMVEGFRTIAELAQQEEMRGLVHGAFAISKRNPMVAKFMQNNWQSRLLSQCAALALDGPAFLRKRVLDGVALPVTKLLADPALLEAHVVQNTHPGGHPGGTCRMDVASRRDTVVDERCRVVGVEGLRVVDASIFPTLMRAGLNIPVIMAAEKAAAMIAEDAR